MAKKAKKGVSTEAPKKKKRKYTRRALVSKAPATQKPYSLALAWCHHDSEWKRVWRTDWPGDTFELMDSKQFVHLQANCIRFNIPLTEAEDD